MREMSAKPGRKSSEEPVTMRERVAHSGVAVLLIVACASLGGEGYGQTAPVAPEICDNPALLNAVRTINDACSDVGSPGVCNMAAMSAIDDVPKEALLSALGDPFLQPTHVFFPCDRTVLAEAFDWASFKKGHLDRLRHYSALPMSRIYVIGIASRTGSDVHDILVAQERMDNVIRYLRDELGLKCKSFKGGYVGHRHLQLDGRDADLLQIPPQEYRNDSEVLNQAVHVFVLPCPDRVR